MQSTLAQLAFSRQAPGLVGVNITAQEFAIEPFLVFTEFHMDRQVFGPHPHAGVSVMTYLLPDSAGGFRNRDSAGDSSHIEPGGLHITQAGRGIHHDEFPITNGLDAHGFQIWINHATADRWVEPRAMHAAAREIAEWRQGSATVRVLHGEYDGVQAVHRMVTPVQLLHIIAGPRAVVTLPPAPMLFLYGLRGSASGYGNEILPQSLLTLADAPQGDLIAGEDGFELMMGAGTPLNQPIVYGGPFVMSTADQMTETRRRYARGEMGTLPPY